MARRDGAADQRPGLDNHGVLMHHLSCPLYRAVPAPAACGGGRAARSTTEAEAQAQAAWIIEQTGVRLKELEIDKQTVVVETIWSLPAPVQP